jgi:hypothetical protein
LGPAVNFVHHFRAFDRRVAGSAPLWDAYFRSFSPGRLWKSARGKAGLALNFSRLTYLQFPQYFAPICAELSGHGRSRFRP